MNGREFAERLAASGLDASEFPEKTRLYDTVLSTLQQSAGGVPGVVHWVPGRLEVFGTHTDYAGGRTLVSALPRGFAFAGRRRTDGQIRVVDAVAAESVTIAPSDHGARSTGWRRYVEVVAERLSRNFPRAALAADIVFASDLPRAAGMSSSSALMVGVASTLVRLSGIRAQAEWQATIKSSVDEAGYYACIENGRTFGNLAGDAGVGTHGGSEDHAAMVCGAPGTLSAYAFVPMRPLESVRLPGEWGVVVASSGVAAEKAGGALESYNRLARGASILHDLWNRSEGPAESLAAALASDPSAPARLRAVVRSTVIGGWTPDALDARLQHFLNEDARVPAALRGFRDVDAGAVTSLAQASQADSEQLLRNQVSETVDLTRIGLACGAFAARSFGAGFGGSVWALVPSGRASSFAQRWLVAYRAKYPHARATSFVAEPGPGLVELGGSPA